MRWTVSAAVVVAYGLLLGTGVARAHDGNDDASGAKFRSTLVADADPGDFGVGSAGGSFVTIGGEHGGRVQMALAGVIDAGGMPAGAAGSQLTITGLVNGMAFTKTFSFDLVAGMGMVDDTLGLADRDLFEIQTVTVASPATGVFAVPGLGAAVDDDDDDDHDHGDGDDDGGEHHGRHGEHDHLVAAHRHGDDGGDDHGGHGDCEGRHGGLGKFRTSLVGDFDAGDYAVDSTTGGFVAIDGGAVSMRIAGVTDGMGAPVDHTGNQLVITGARNGVPFTTTFPFDLVGGVGEVDAMLDVMDGEVVEIRTVALTDGTNVFAVPGFLVRGGDDDDDDGVPDGEDACTGTGVQAMVSGDGCSLSQRCACGPPRGALRACLRAAAKDVKSHLRGSCHAKACRRPLRALAAERRSVLRSCGGAARR